MLLFEISHGPTENGECMNLFVGFLQVDGQVLSNASTVPTETLAHQTQSIQLNCIQLKGLLFTTIQVEPMPVNPIRMDLTVSNLYGSLPSLKECGMEGGG